MSGNRTKGNIVLCPATLLRLMTGGIAILVALHLIGLYLRFELGRDYALGFVPLFDLDSEKNAPTLYSSMLLISASVLAFLAAVSAPEFRWRWRLIGLVLLVLGVDETFGLHEPIFFVLRGNESATTAAWVNHFGGLHIFDLLPWISLVAAALFFWYWPLILKSRRISLLGFGACAIYLFGALGLDLLTAAEYAGEFSNRATIAIKTLEEVAELIGVSLIVYSIALYIVEIQGTTVSLSSRA